MSFFSFLNGQGTKESQEAKRLIAEVRNLRARSTLPDEEAEYGFILEVMAESLDEFDATPGTRLGGAVFDLVNILFAHEHHAVNLDTNPDDMGLAEGTNYRNRLRLAASRYANDAYLLKEWKDYMGAILGGLFDEFPEHCFVDPDENGNFEEYSRLAPKAPLFSYIKGIPLLLRKIIGTVFQQKLVDENLFDSLREQLHINAARASNIPIEDRHTTKKQFVMPDEKHGLDDEVLIKLYFDDTPLLGLFMLEIPLHIPEAVRFEHTHVLAGTGHGKTQTLQFLIAGDLEQAIKERRSVVVMDSQGDLLNTLMKSEYFANDELRSRFVYIDPQDLERPVGLNLFDVDLSPGSIPDAVARESILNNTVELYDFFFGALLGAELTQKQGVIFRYLAVLMMCIPNANVHTLRELMEDGDKFRPYMKMLRGSAKVFFETRFFDRSFSETKKQILNRLWGVLSSQTLDRMMSAPKNSVDLFSSLQQGSIVFINTAKDFLGEEGSTIFSRMFVALLGQALMRRAAIERHERTPTYIYIDEAERVVDQTLTRMLAQVRKYKGAITFAHQNLDQLDPTIRAGVMANTSIKLAGGVSAKDARALADDFRCSSDFLLGQKKKRTESHFACFARNVTDQAVSLSIPLGYVESGKTLSAQSVASLIEESRKKYGTVYVEEPAQADTPVESAADWLGGKEEEIVEPPITSSIPASIPAVAIPAEVAEAPIVIVREEAVPRKDAPRDPGGGGVKHKYLNI